MQILKTGRNAISGKEKKNITLSQSNLLLVFFFFLLLSAYTFAATYYVSPSGNDSNPGTQNQPWKSIQKAASTLTAGDVVYIMAGTYFERVTPQNSGTSSNWITYSAYPGDFVVIDGSGLSSGWNGVFRIQNRNYIRVTGIKIQNSPSNGFLVENCNQIVIEGNHTFDTYNSGIGVWNSTNIIINNNNVERACNGGFQECITIAKTDGFEVSNNEVHSTITGTNGGEGIDAKDGSKNGKIFNNYVHNLKRIGIYVDAWNKHTYNIDVYNNIVHDCDDGFAVASEEGGLLENVRFFNNIAYHNEWRGIIISGCCGSHVAHTLKNVVVANNTFYNNGWTNWGGGIHIENSDIINLTIVNNIVSQNRSFQIALEGPIPLPQLLLSNNLIHGFKNYPGEIRGTSFIEGDPKFVNASANDFRLQPTSPAIDNGISNNAPSFDYDYKPRPLGGGFDIGAFEYGTTTGINNELQPESFLLEQNYPNPFNPTTSIRFAVPKATSVKLGVYNMLGEEVAVLVNEVKEAGYHSVEWNGNNHNNIKLPSGVYIYRIESPEYNSSKKMIMLK